MTIRKPIAIVAHVKEWHDKIHYTSYFSWQIHVYYSHTDKEIIKSRMQRFFKTDHDVTMAKAMTHIVPGMYEYGLTHLCRYAGIIYYQIVENDCRRRAAKEWGGES